MGDYQMKNMWLSLSLCDAEGGYKEGFALELRSMSLHGLYDRDMVFDITHADGERERIQFKAIPGRTGITAFFRLGSLVDYIGSMQVRGEYPAILPVSKDEFRIRCGIGMLLNAQGHFVATT